MLEKCKLANEISYPTVEVRCGHDVIACPCDGANCHELGCHAACSRYSSHPAFECGNSFLKYFLRVITNASE